MFLSFLLSRLFCILLPSMSLYDVRLSHLNKDYLLTYLLTTMVTRRLMSLQTGQVAHWIARRPIDSRTNQRADWSTRR